MGVSPQRPCIVLAPNVFAAKLAGFSSSSRFNTIVTPRNLDIALRGYVIDSSVRVVAVGLDGDQADRMLDHRSVAPAWIRCGRPPVKLVSTH